MTVVWTRYEDWDKLNSLTIEIPLSVPLSLPGPGNIYQIFCFSISVWIAFLTLEVLNHFPQHPALSLAEDGT